MMNKTLEALLEFWSSGIMNAVAPTFSKLSLLYFIIVMFNSAFANKSTYKW